MKVMHIGQEVRAIHGLTSSHPTGWIVGRGTHGVITEVMESQPLLYAAQFPVFRKMTEVVTVEGISGRDIVPAVRTHKTQQSLPIAS